MAEAQTLPLTKLSTFTVATVPDAASFKDTQIIVSDGHDGSPCVARSNGTVWINQRTGAPITAATVAVAALPAAASYPGAIRHCNNGNAGAASLVYSDGTNWKVVALGSTAAAS